MEKNKPKITPDFQFIIVTGLSGAGRTTLSRIFEDMSFFVVDNMPPELIPKFGEICIKSSGRINKVLLVLDIRGGFTTDELFLALDDLRKMNISYQIIFLEATDDALVKRFSETRRRHPLGDRLILTDAINEEREILAPLREKASLIIDTTKLNIWKLKEVISEFFTGGKQNAKIIINLISFGFKYGLPSDADIVLDLRFLPNPFYVPHLKELTGRDKEVVDYIMQAEIAQKFKEKLFDFIDFLLPQYIKEGKSRIEIAFGCTGGKHRSVAFSEMLYLYLKSKDYSVIIKHREI